MGSNSKNVLAILSLGTVIVYVLLPFFIGTDAWIGVMVYSVIALVVSASSELWFACWPLSSAGSLTER